MDSNDNNRQTAGTLEVIKFCPLTEAQRGRDLPGVPGGSSGTEIQARPLKTQACSLESHLEGLELGFLMALTGSLQHLPGISFSFLSFELRIKEELLEYQL